METVDWGKCGFVNRTYLSIENSSSKLAEAHPSPLQSTI